MAATDPEAAIALRPNGRTLGECDRRISVDKSLELYRERPGEQKIRGRRAAARRGVRDTAICSKPSTRLWGLNWFQPALERCGKVILADLRRVDRGCFSGIMYLLQPGPKPTCEVYSGATSSTTFHIPCAMSCYR